MQYKKWLRNTLMITLLVALPFIGIVIYNYYIDPLWNFEHAHPSNAVNLGFDERQQKMNKVTHSSFDYDTLIVGTSRTTFIDQHEFKGHRAFNYAVSEMGIDEYHDYIEYAKRINGKEFDYIVMELYFDGFRKGVIGRQRPLETYHKTTDAPFYRVRSLFSFDMFERAKRNQLYSRSEQYLGPRYYTRDNVAKTNFINDEIEQTMEAYKRRFKQESSSEYPVDPEYFEILKEIKRNNPNTEFLLFIEPMAAERIQLILGQEVNWDAYQKWVKEVVEIYDGVYNFMYVNSVTDDLSHYFDEVHFYPEIGTMIAHRLTDYEKEELPSDFGIYVTAENVEQHLNFMKQQIEVGR
ncbi:hypothetical protein BEP19_12245 [Ammoniphilus oxalaticus]|uniref:Uncharacterized protein n=1 Tax=Ammoniphilus oxalaticus TaxID=66863 RepID=A0A419SGY5_9BACL|nr:hypothetical protein [Ammoniphilus oxalaticus]RKD22995.1 hypothetical protein BEP19_12245 [Ammoniphilus oxalaticus]